MIRVYSSIFLFSLFIGGCFSEEQSRKIKDNRIELGDVKFNYYSDKSVSSLEVPPDLTKPSYENSFRLSEIAPDVNLNEINLTDKDNSNRTIQILKKQANIEVKSYGNRKWLVVDKGPETVWGLSQQFLKEKGFTLKKSNKKIGIIETDYLENKPTIPEKSLGTFRSIMSATIGNVSYTLPIVDKYTIRIEPLNDNTKTEVHLSLHSMAEVITGSGSNESTLWQNKEKDITLETEMLYSLMVYLGSESASAREKILNAKEEGKISVKIQDSIGGYAKLVFDLNLADTWDNMAWAITESNIELEDKDIKEKAFYVQTARTADVGIFSRLFGDNAVQKPFQILLKSISKNKTEVYFNDISELNEKETKEFSYVFFEKILKVF